MESVSVFDACLLRRSNPGICYEEILILRGFEVMRGIVMSQFSIVSYPSYNCVSEAKT